MCALQVTFLFGFPPEGVVCVCLPEKDQENLYQIVGYFLFNARMYLFFCEVTYILYIVFWDTAVCNEHTNMIVPRKPIPHDEKKRIVLKHVLCRIILIRTTVCHTVSNQSLYACKGVYECEWGLVCLAAPVPSSLSRDTDLQPLHHYQCDQFIRTSLDTDHQGFET